MLLPSGKVIFEGFDNVTSVMLFIKHLFLPSIEQFASPSPILFILGLASLARFGVHIILNFELFYI